MEGSPNWKRFWKTLQRLGSSALTGVPRNLKGAIDSQAEDTDDFWSQQLVDGLASEWRATESPEDVARVVLVEYADNIRSSFRDVVDETKLKRIAATNKLTVVKCLATAMMPRKLYDSVDEIEKMPRYQATLRTGSGSASLAKKVYEHCHQRHQIDGVPTRLRWPEPPNTLIAEPSYFSIAAMNAVQTSVSVFLWTTDWWDFVPYTLGEAMAKKLDFGLIAPAKGPKAGVANRIRFVITHEDQLPLACRILDRAHMLFC